MKSKTALRTISKELMLWWHMLRAIETGYVQKEIQESAYRYQRAIEQEESVVVGVNRFQSEEGSAITTLRVNPAIEQQQARALARRARAA